MDILHINLLKIINRKLGKFETKFSQRRLSESLPRSNDTKFTLTSFPLTTLESGSAFISQNFMLIPVLESTGASRMLVAFRLKRMPNTNKPIRPLAFPFCLTLPSRAADS